MEYNPKYKIVEYIGCVSDPKKPWRTELNIIEWNGQPAKYDLRKWKGDHEQMGKGIALSKEELVNLRNLIDDELENLQEEE